MNDYLVLTVDFLIKFFVFGQLYLLWVRRIRPAIQKHYSLAKSNVSALENIPRMWRSLCLDLQTYYYTLKSLLAALPGDIYATIRDSEFLHRNFPATMKFFCITRNQKIQ